MTGGIGTDAKQAARDASRGVQHKYEETKDAAKFVADKASDTVRGQSSMGTDAKAATREATRETRHGMENARDDSKSMGENVRDSLNNAYQAAKGNPYRT